MFSKLNKKLPAGVRNRLFDVGFFKVLRESNNFATSSFTSGSRWPNKSVSIKDVDVYVPGFTKELHDFYFGKDNVTVEKGTVTIMWFSGDSCQLIPHIDLYRECAINTCLINNSGFTVGIYEAKPGAEVLLGKSYKSDEITMVNSFHHGLDDIWLLDTTAIHGIPEFSPSGTVMIISYGWVERTGFSYSFIKSELERVGML